MKSHGPATKLRQIYDRINSWGFSGPSCRVTTIFRSYWLLGRGLRAQWLSYDRFTIVLIVWEKSLCPATESRQVYDRINSWGFSGPSFRVTTHFWSYWLLERGLRAQQLSYDKFTIVLIHRISLSMLQQKIHPVDEIWVMALLRYISVIMSECITDTQVMRHGDDTVETPTWLMALLLKHGWWHCWNTRVMTLLIELLVDGTFVETILLRITKDLGDIFSVCG